MGQDDVIAALSESTAYGGRPIRKITTHAAVVLLIGDRAIKIKRAVRYPFLDYSTLALRKAACEAEIAVNRPFAPQIYRSVVPITRSDRGQIDIGGSGEVVEWAVDMRRFDEESTLDHVAESGPLEIGLVKQLVDTVIAAHKIASRTDGSGWLKSLQSYIEQNDAALRAEPELFPENRVDALARNSLAQLERVTPLLMKRTKAGFVRRCHGDLHLANIALIDNAPVLFDAIEFDPSIASGDVLYDLAFLLMDLIYRRQQYAANVVLNAYLVQWAELAQYEGLAALPLFLSLRAAIRAQVTTLRLRLTRENAQGLWQAARDYFALAERLIEPSQPKFVAIGGLSGTGKSLLAQVLAPEIPPAPGAVVLRSDLERKALFGVRETDRLPTSAYTGEVTKKVYAALAAKASLIASAGHSVIIDAVFAHSREREAIKTSAAGAGVPFVGLFLRADLQTRVSRVRGRFADASDADEAVVRQQATYDIGPMTWTDVDASGPMKDTQAAAEAAIRSTSH